MVRAELVLASVASSVRSKVVVVKRTAAKTALAVAVQAEEEEPASRVGLEESTSAAVEVRQEEEEPAWLDPSQCSGLLSSRRLP